MNSIVVVTAAAIADDAIGERMAVLPWVDGKTHNTRNVYIVTTIEMLMIPNDE